MAISRLLIANRGEIAVRVIASCRRLGIESVAVFSEADRYALHVRSADQAVCIGAPEASASYLNQAAVLEAARRCGADAVHPGYGFLSENESFAQAVCDAGLVWVGPHPDAMRRMASKIEARRLAASLDIPLVPGREDVDPAQAAAIADEIGYPLMIKASAGGGGRGIRIVHAASELEEAAKSAQAEAEAAFSDGSLIFERYVERPRHIEVQVLGDRSGNCVHLFERECSIQRRHQKVVEEAPAPNLEESTRQALFAYALTLARAMDYDSVGTVEFLLDANSGEVFFLEMNTRLQVEHPVTEAVTGLDLVALQLRSAAGEPLPFSQSDLSVSGSSIEVRVNAEDPERGFAPQVGQLWAYRPPGDGARFDSGVASGSKIPPHYDSMLAKLIVHGNSRDEACAKLQAALARTVIAGVRSNLTFLAGIALTPAFRRGELSTRFLEEHAELSDAAVDEGEGRRIAGLALTVPQPGASDEVPSPWESLGRWRLLSSAGHPEQVRWYLESQNGTEEVTVSGDYEVEVGGHLSRYRADWNDEGALSVERDGIRRRYDVARFDDRIAVTGGDLRCEFRVVPREEHFGLGDGGGPGDAREIRAPFPGLIAELRVGKGDQVEAGDVIVVVEAMKMMHNLTATGPGSVSEILCEQGASVEGGQVLVRFAEEDNA